MLSLESLGGCSWYFVYVLGVPTKYKITLNSAKKSKNPRQNCLRPSAEREGFEPSVRLATYAGLANRWFQPLTHLSGHLAECYFFIWRICYAQKRKWFAASSYLFRFFDTRPWSPNAIFDITARRILCRRKRISTTRNLNQLLGDRILTGAVVLEP